MDNSKLLIAIDGNSLMHRAYYALPPMTSADGSPTGAVFGFLNMLLKLIERNPDYLVVAFDMHGPTFRHAQYEDYKAGRRETPQDLRPQFPLLQEILRELGILVVECESYEADDILGTYARMADEAGVDTLLVTGDRDALQLISDTTHVLLTKKGITETLEMDKAALLESYGLTPSRMRDLKGLMGDTSDHIPGIPGVGEKTAIKLLEQYGSMEDVLAHAGEIKGKLGEKLHEHAHLARLSYALGVINTEAPIRETLEDSIFHTESLAAGRTILHRYQLNAIAKRLPAEEGALQMPMQEQVHVKRIRVEALEALDALLALCEQTGTLALHAAEDMLLLAADAQTEYSVRFAGTLLEPGLDEMAVFERLRPVLEKPRIEKYCYDEKKWLHRLDAYAIVPQGICFDAMIADYLLNANRPSASLEALAQARLGEPQGACVLHRLYPLMKQQMIRDELLSLYEDVEMPLIGVLYHMEHVGFRIDTQVLRHMDAQFSERIEKLAAEIYQLAGDSFNILSPKQLGSVLFEKLALPPQRKTKTGYSTDVDVLEALCDMHPIIAPIQEYRFLTKLKSTFVVGLLQAVSPKDGRVHTSFNQNVTATGRISSTEPNLQNIPVRTELGREIRKAFIPSEGNILIGADYSQIELRLLAHISGDETMIDAFLSGGDFHTKTASEVFDVSPEQVTSEQRSAAKAVNFGIVYGISDFGLARNLGIGKKQAGEYIEKYLDRYPGIRAYMQQSVEDGKANGYVKTLLHRRRDLPELKSSQYTTRAFGERVAMNMPIQGSAADIIKLAMVDVDRVLRAQKLSARLILQVHDELLLDVPPQEEAACVEIVRACMEKAMRLRVPLTAEVRSGKSWYDTK